MRHVASLHYVPRGSSFPIASPWQPRALDRGDLRFAGSSRYSHKPPNSPPSANILILEKFTFIVFLAVSRTASPSIIPARLKIATVGTVACRNPTAHNKSVVYTSRHSDTSDSRPKPNPPFAFRSNASFQPDYQSSQRPSAERRKADFHFEEVS